MTTSGGYPPPPLGVFFACMPMIWGRLRCKVLPRPGVKTACNSLFSGGLGCDIPPPRWVYPSL